MPKHRIYDTWYDKENSIFNLRVTLSVKKLNLFENKLNKEIFSFHDFQFGPNHSSSSKRSTPPLPLLPIKATTCDFTLTG